MIAMIYLERTTVGRDGTPLVEIAAVEHEQNAAHYEALGFRRCSFETFRAAWQRRDKDEFARLRATGTTAVAPSQAGEADRTGQATRTYPRS